jgi:hypothetical protein
MPRKSNGAIRVAAREMRHVGAGRMHCSASKEKLNRVVVDDAWSTIPLPQNVIQRPELKKVFARTWGGGGVCGGVRRRLRVLVDGPCAHRGRLEQVERCDDAARLEQDTEPNPIQLVWFTLTT